MSKAIQILYVDDSPFDQLLVRDVLEREHGGFAVTEARSFEEFEESLGQRMYDILISDFNILGLDGLQVMDLCHKKAPGLPVIILTGTGSEEIAVEAMKRGADDYVIKTRDHIRRLPQTIRSVLHHNKIQKERELAEKRREESEARYRQLAEVTFEGIAFHDQGFLLQANDQYFQMFGYEPEDLIGTQAIDKTISSDSVEVVWTQIAARSTGPYEAVGLRKDGTTFPIEIRARMWEMDGKEIRATAIRDLSERKNLEQQFLQAQKMEAIGTLAGGIAHDFNNLLQIVLGYAELILQRQKAGDRDHADLQKILQAGKRGADLVKSLLTFSRRMLPRMDSIDLNHEIIQIQKLLSRTIPRTINIDLRLSDRLAPVQADASQIGQVLMNLGVNARDAMPDGGTLSIETTTVELDDGYCGTRLEIKPGRYVLLTVSDTGLGMDRQTCAHIFEPFFSTKEVGKGTGLGLATVYGIVKQHDGHINCYSEPGHGTTFKIYLPVSETARDTQATKEEEPLRGGTETILLVDDEEVLRQLGTALLSMFGYEILTAANGREALEIYQEKGESISLVILDLIMPEMDGKACLKEILQRDPKAKVIMASGHPENVPVNGTGALGAKGFIEKPYNTRTLIQTVRDVLDADCLS